jgi:hypothetical protein
MGTQITMTGADGAHYLSATAETARLVPFPDGVTRHIVLTNWQWQIFDTWTRDGWRMPPLVLEMVSAVIEELGPLVNYEEEVRLALHSLIREAMAGCSAHEPEGQNDNAHQ